MYETKADLGRERVFSRFIGQKFNCTLEKLPIRYGLDFAAVRDGNVVSFMEIKMRTVAVSHYPSYMISVSKFMAANALHETTGLRSTLVVGWTDVWGHLPMVGNTSLGPVSFGGRVDRGDSQDMEPVYLIPMSRFTFMQY